MDSIQEFISRRFNSNLTWQNGNCYWFAKILSEQFPELKIYYFPIVGHFAAGDGKNFYDSKGKYFPEEQGELLENIKNNDINHYNRLMRDCKN